ncbi:MAG TPA: ABC transporter permease [Mucilaginibacter sp.]|jgi:ABC-type antimicrobial peptide transport system permease subunit|nr:ABC transporter permease [Mucilaginibacter sp.]
MLRNYFKSAWRSIIRGRGYSALNIFGLATGMAVALIIGLWVHNQNSYDKFLPGYGQLYQVERHFYGNGDTLTFGGTSLKLADVIRNQIPEIAAVAETDGGGQHGLKVADKKLYMQGESVARDFLTMFQYPLLEGKANSVLSDPNSIVLTESTAKALFGNEDAINKIVRYDNKNNLKVTGILKDIPANSTLQFGFLVPFSYLEATDDFVKRARSAGFGWTNFGIYAQTKPGVTYAQVAAKVKDLEKSEKDNSMSMTTNVILDPLTNWHLYDNYDGGKPVAGFIEYVRIFSIVGILVLLIACINFINLTTARSGKRAKEVGVRKAIGSGKKELVIQFLIESVVLTFIAFLFSVILVQLALPSFNTLTRDALTIPFTSVWFWVITLCCVLVTALAAGSRPAFYLSSFNPVKVLKSSIHVGKAATLPRKILVVAQFTCSIALIISTFIIYQQVQYAKDRPSGYDKNRLVMTDMNEDLARNYTAISDEMRRQGIADKITTASNDVTTGGNHRDVDAWPGKKPGESVNMGYVHVTADYFKTVGMTMKEGRNFSGNSDTLNVIFNEAAVKLLQLNNPINQVITNSDTHYKIVGVVKDAVMASPFEPADPTIFMYEAKPQNVMLYKLSAGIKTQGAITKLTAIFNKYNAAYPFTCTFADDSYAAKFKLEVLIGKLAGLFAVFAIFISCLGLFGLAAYTAEQRNKEIGIRKVLGASVPQVWLLLSKDFILLVLISCLIASPVALYFLTGWLQKYDYRITISPFVFVLAAIAAIVITIITISFQSIKAALANPVSSLRSE